MDITLSLLAFALSILGIIGCIVPPCRAWC